MIWQSTLHRNRRARFCVRFHGLLAIGLCLTAFIPMRAWGTVDQSVVVNELLMAPEAGGTKYIEILNRGMQAVNTSAWWICDQPSSTYRRLLQIPNDGGGSTSPGIDLLPGDFLVIYIQSPNGEYSVRPNSAGTQTHSINIDQLPQLVLNAGANNVSIWQQLNPETPDFTAATLIRDFVATAANGDFVGIKRGCVASQPIAALWPPPFMGDCDFTPPSFVHFIAVNSNELPAVSGLSVNYNGASNNDPRDYFIAPATAGEPNVMPGDLDNDFDIDNDDADLFAACIGQPPTSPSCARADFDGDGDVDCADWPFFLEDWGRYSMLPAPQTPLPCITCVRGDINNDGVVSLDDVPAFYAVLQGLDSDPFHRCAADAYVDGVLDCNDFLAFSALLLGSTGGCHPGDFDGDGRATGADIQWFVLVATTPGCLTARNLCAIDVNRDVTFDEADVSAFIDLLLGEP